MSSPTWHQHLVSAFPEWQVEDYSGNNFGMVKDFEIACGETVLIGICETSVFSLLHPSGDPMTVTEYNKYLALDSEWIHSDECVEPLIVRDEGDGYLTVTSTGETWCDPPMLENLKKTLALFLKQQ